MRTTGRRLPMSIVVALLSIELHLPGARSLKDKRMVLRRVKGCLQKFNVAVAEVDFLDRWQRAQIGVVAISNSSAAVHRSLESAVAEIDRVEPGLIARTQVDVLT